MPRRDDTPLSDRERAYFGPRADKPPGSVAWCWQTILLMQSRWQQKTIDEAGFNALVEELRAYEAWNVVPPERPYGSLEALLHTEIGCSEQEAKQRLLAAATSQGERTDLDKLSKSPQAVRAQQNGLGIVSQRKLDYLARQAPELLRAVQAQTLTLHRAYEQARGHTPPTPLDALKRAWNRACREDRRQFLQSLSRGLSRKLATGGQGDTDCCTE